MTALYNILVNLLDKTFFGASDNTLRAGETPFKRSADYSFATLHH